LLTLSPLSVVDPDTIRQVFNDTDGEQLGDDRRDARLRLSGRRKALPPELQGASPAGSSTIE
jgi:hypothetical protein